MKIAVGVDGSEGSKHALLWAAEEARLRGADVLIVAVWSYPAAVAGPTFGVLPAPEEMVEDREKLVAQMRADAGLDLADDLKVDVLIPEGPAAPVLVDISAQVDLLVIGARGLGGFRGLLVGSVSQHCTSHGLCPIVVIPAKAHS